MTRSVLCIARSSTPRTITSELAKLRHCCRCRLSSSIHNHCLPTPRCVNNMQAHITFPIVCSEAPPNCCKRLTKRRLFARAPTGALQQSTLDGRHAARSSVCKIGKRRAAVSVAVFSRFAIYANVVGPTDTPRNWQCPRDIVVTRAVGRKASCGQQDVTQFAVGHSKSPECS
jgi:hypothetical protein